MRTRNNAKKTSENKPRPITVDEMEKAEIEILKLVQKHAFPDETAALKEVMAENNIDNRKTKRREKQNLKKTSSLFRLDPFIDEDDLLRVGGRLSKSDKLTEDLKHPVILPKESHITYLERAQKQVLDNKCQFDSETLYIKMRYVSKIACRCRWTNDGRST